LIAQSLISSTFLVLAIKQSFRVVRNYNHAILFFRVLGYFKSNTAGLTLAPFSKTPGSASALMGACS
jgi:hypothetical protein